MKNIFYSINIFFQHFKTDNNSQPGHIKRKRRREIRKFKIGPVRIWPQRVLYISETKKGREMKKKTRKGCALNHSRL